METIHNVFRVPIVLHPALAEAVERFPILTIAAFENEIDILQMASTTSPRPAPPQSPRSTHPVSETPSFLVPIIREKCTDPRPGSAVYRYEEGGLNLVAWMNELGVVNGPECVGECNELFFAK